MGLKPTPGKSKFQMEKKLMQDGSNVLGAVLLKIKCGNSLLAFPVP